MRDDGAAVGPGGRQDEGFIAGIERAADADVERLHAGGGDDDFGGRVEFDGLQAAVVIGQMARRRDGRPAFSV